MRTALIWDDALGEYRFTRDHPLNPRRLELTLELIRALNLVDDDTHRIVAARIASIAEIQAAHDAAFIDAVRSASTGSVSSSSLQRFGLGTQDVPIVPHMHEAAAHVAGATLRAAELVMSGDVQRAFSIAGGLHHARRAEASGFCIYNDLAIAIRWLQRECGARVLYVDIDAHHGDGVQWIFYDDPDVLTVSLHESGAFLYPGTGFIDEMGEGDGYGYAVNVPLDPHSDDASLVHAAETLLPPLADAFHPDVIVLQAGCDAHVLDPLTHLRCTTSVYHTLVKLIGTIADTHCKGRIIATGGGGYAIYAVVPRAWALVWAALCNEEVADAVPEPWLRRTRAEAMSDVPATLRDAPEDFPRSDLSIAAEAHNRRTVDAVRRRCLPLITGWGLAF